MSSTNIIQAQSVPLESVIVAWYRDILNGRFKVLYPDPMIQLAFQQHWNINKLFPSISDIVKIILNPNMVQLRSTCYRLQIANNFDITELDTKIFNAGLYCFMVLGGIGHLYYLESMFLYYELERQYTLSRTVFYNFVQRRHESDSNLFEYSTNANDTIQTKATHKQYQELPKTISNDEHCKQSCTLCLLHFCTNQEIIQLRCNHIFHSSASEDCPGLMNWALSQNKCPLCRSAIIN